MGSNGRLIGGLTGLGGGAIGAAVGYWLFNDPEGPMFILGPLFGAAIATMGFVAGYAETIRLSVSVSTWVK